MWLILLKPSLWLLIVYILLSVLFLIFFKQIKRHGLRSFLITSYFCISLFSITLLWSTLWALSLGERWEFLRQSSVNTSENVRILTLLHKSNAQNVDLYLYKSVTHNLENEIDVLLPIANDYLKRNKSIEWRLHDWLYNDMKETIFRRDLPSVVQYRKIHPQVWDHGPYDLVMTTYSEETATPERLNNN
jgi:hypothetical protein